MVKARVTTASRRDGAPDAASSAERAPRSHARVSTGAFFPVRHPAPSVSRANNNNSVGRGRPSGSTMDRDDTVSFGSPFVNVNQSVLPFVGRVRPYRFVVYTRATVGRTTWTRCHELDLRIASLTEEDTRVTRSGRPLPARHDLPRRARRRSSPRRPLGDSWTLSEPASPCWMTSR